MVEPSAIISMIEIGKNLYSASRKTKPKTTTKVIAMFDLTGSTAMKVQRGHTYGIKTALIHNILCRDLFNKFDGSIVKELGDGILATFDDPLKACLASINLKNVMTQEKIQTKGALTIGKVEEISLENSNDILGSPVDKCSRILGCTLPMQILIDRALHDIVISFLKDYADVLVSQSISTHLREYGSTEIYEISSQQLGLKGHISYPFRIYEEGRLSIEEKVAFMKGACSQVIELGTGLTEFSNYFYSRRPSI